MVMLTCVTAVGPTGAALIPACTARAIAHEQMQNGGNVPWHRTRSLCRPLSATQSPYQIIYSLFFLSLPGVRASLSLCVYVCLSLYLSFSTLNSLFLFHRPSFFFLCVTSLSSFFLSPLLQTCPVSKFALRQKTEHVFNCPWAPAAARKPTSRVIMRECAGRQDRQRKDVHILDEWRVKKVVKPALYSSVHYCLLDANFSSFLFALPPLVGSWA